MSDGPNINAERALEVPREKRARSCEVSQPRPTLDVRPDSLAHQLHQATGGLVPRDVVVLRAKGNIGRQVVTLAIGGEYVTHVLVLEVPVLFDDSAEILPAPLWMQLVDRRTKPDIDDFP